MIFDEPLFPPLTLTARFDANFDKFSVKLDCCQLILEINIVEGKRLSRNRETGNERLPR